MKKNSRNDKHIFTLHINIDQFYKVFGFARQVDIVDAQKNVTFLDEYKSKQPAKISSCNVGQHCFWDRHPFNWEGIQCPLRKEYQPNLKVYKSNINDNTYVIQDTLSNETAEYLTEGYFCSPECCLAYILDNVHNPAYIDSEALLYELTREKVRPAGSWRLLKEYGGSMSIEEFRGAFTSKLYTLEAVIYKPSYFVFKENYHL